MSSKLTKKQMNPSVDAFLETAKHWKAEITAVRSLLLKTKLDEDFKWRLPCYSYNGGNVVIIQPFKECLGLMFFKGTLLKDAKKLLVANGPNSRSSKRLELRSEAEVTRLKATLLAYVKEAIEIEESGKKVEVAKVPEKIPAELKSVFAKKPKVKKAFDALTPGRRRAYLLHFSSAKQAATRESRIEKCIPAILAGKGFNER